MSESRVAVLTVLIEDMEAAERVNALLHEFGKHIIGRMGIPYRDRGVSVICVVLDPASAPKRSTPGRARRHKTR